MVYASKVNESTQPRTAAPVIGGALSIVSSIVTALVLIIPVTIDHFRYLSGELPFSPVGIFFVSFFGLRVVLLTASVLAFVGGVLAVNRRCWVLALAGAIASTFSFSSIFPGIIATILVAKSKKEFDNTFTA